MGCKILRPSPAHQIIQTVLLAYSLTFPAKQANEKNIFFRTYLMRHRFMQHK